MLEIVIESVLIVYQPSQHVAHTTEPSSGAVFCQHMSYHGWNIACIVRGSCGTTGFVLFAVSGTSNTCSNACCEMLGCLCKLPAAEDISSSCIIKCVSSLTSKRVRTYQSASSAVQAAMRILRQLSVAQSLPAATLLDLLQTALAARNKVVAADLLTWPAAMLFDGQAVHKLLQQAIRVYVNTSASEPVIMSALFQLPAATQISAEAAADLIKQAMALGPVGGLPVLCSKLVNLDAEALLPLIITAALHGDDECDDEALHYLLKAPAAQQLTAQQLLQLTPLVIKHAAANSDDELIPLILDLPAARQWDAEAVEQLLLCAIRERFEFSVSQLVNGSFADSLSSTQVARLLPEAVKQGLGEAVDALCNLPSACKVQTDVLFEAVLAGLELKLGKDFLCRLCGLLHTSMSSNSSSGGISDGGNSSKQLTANLPFQAQWRSAADSSAVQAPVLQGNLLQRHQQQRGHAKTQAGAAYASMLTRILDAAVIHECVDIVSVFVDSQAAEGLFNSQRISQLMQKAIEQHCYDLLDRVCGLPAARNVPAAEVHDMLFSAMQYPVMKLYEPFIRLPAVKEAGPETAKLLLQRAQTSSHTDAINSFLAWIPATQQLDPDSLLALMMANMQLSTGSHVVNYMQCPAACLFSVDQVTDLLRAAFTMSHWIFAESLCSTVLAARELNAATAKALLQTCITCSRARPASGDPDTDYGQIDTALPALLRLPCCKQLTCPVVYELLQEAIEQEQRLIVQQLVHLPVAAELSAEDMHQLLRSVVNLGSRTVTLQCIWELPACKHITATAMAGLFELAVIRGFSSHVDSYQAAAVMQEQLLFLLKQPVMQQLDGVVLRRLLSLVTKHDSLSEVEEALTVLLGGQVLVY